MLYVSNIPGHYHITTVTTVVPGYMYVHILTYIAMERYECDIRRLVGAGVSHSAISLYLRQCEPSIHRGLSEQSV